jgi:hypothetical protein
MKVKELIEKLQMCNPESFVLTPSYEGGLDFINSPRDALVVLNTNNQDDDCYRSYEGQHSEVHEDWLNKHTVTKVIVLGRCGGFE